MFTFKLKYKNLINAAECRNVLVSNLFIMSENSYTFIDILFVSFSLASLGRTSRYAVGNDGVGRNESCLVVVQRLQSSISSSC